MQPCVRGRGVTQCTVSGDARWPSQLGRVAMQGCQRAVVLFMHREYGHATANIQAVMQSYLCINSRRLAAQSGERNRALGAGRLRWRKCRVRCSSGH